MRQWKMWMASALALALMCGPMSALAVEENHDGDAGGSSVEVTSVEMVDASSDDADVTSTVYEDPDVAVNHEGLESGLIGAAFVNNEYFENGFELPLKGATGWGVCALNVRQKDDIKSRKMTVVQAGVAFEILEEGDKYLNVRLADGTEGWVSTAYTMVNLPDVLPSVVYNAVNSEAAMFKSQGKDLPGVTGKALYDVSRENERLGHAEYDMPVLYSMAVKIAAAQRAALVNGDTLMICETYRPMTTQKAVVAALQTLMKSDAAVRNDINGWGTSWFIATGISNHQRGYAVDLTLGKVQDVESFTCGHYTMNVPGAVVEYEMPTVIHELSTKAAALAKPVTSLSETGWKTVDAAETMTEGAKLLQKYMTDAGLTPLTSEWWHFNDLAARKGTSGAGTGAFELSPNVSKAYDINIELPMVDEYVYVNTDHLGEFDPDEPAMMTIPEGAQGLYN